MLLFQIVHGKLCAKHILLGSKYTAKISGLKARGGMSQIVRWTAPEAIHEMKYSSQCDVCVSCPSRDNGRNNQLFQLIFEKS